MDFDDIDTVAVLGAGNMGHGIAEVAALAGYDVRMRDINDGFVQDGYDSIEWSLDKLAEKDQISQEDADAALDRVTALVDLEAAVGDADVVIEAVPEKMAIKKDVYTDVEEHAPTRPSSRPTPPVSLSPNFPEVTERPEQFCGMHFSTHPFGCERSRSSPAPTRATRRRRRRGTRRSVRENPGPRPERLARLHRQPHRRPADERGPRGSSPRTRRRSPRSTTTTKHDMGLPMGAFGFLRLRRPRRLLRRPRVRKRRAGLRLRAPSAAPGEGRGRGVRHEEREGFYDYDEGEGVQIPATRAARTSRRCSSP